MSSATRFLAVALALVLALPAAAQVRLQIIHNAPDPAADQVDVYVNGALTLDDFAFRTATEFLELAADTDLEVAVAPASSSSAGDAVFTETYNLPSGAYQLIASGVLDASAFEDNPDGEPIAFTLLVGADTRESAETDGNVSVRVVHGATDAPTVDVRSGGAVLVDDASYTDVTGYLDVAAQPYTLDVTTADGATTVATFGADLSGGGAVTVLASGFLTPDDDQDGPAFGLLAVFPDGTAALLSEGAVSAEEAPAPGRFALGAPAPNPAATQTGVVFSLAAPGQATVALYDALGRRVAVVADGAFGAEPVEVGVDTARLAAGVYVLRLETDAGVRARTVTVVR